MPFRRRRSGLFPGRRSPGQPIMQGRRSVPPIVKQAFRTAHRHVAAGEYEAAITIYKRLSETAYNRGRVRLGAQMEFEIARIQLMMNAFEEAKDSVLHAVEMLIHRNAVPGIIMPLVNRIHEALLSEGEDEAADIFKGNIDRILSSHGYSPDDFGRPTVDDGIDTLKNNVLPELCPSCSAPIHADEMVWSKPGRTQCTYCGRPIVTQ